MVVADMVDRKGYQILLEVLILIQEAMERHDICLQPVLTSPHQRFIMLRVITEG